MTELIQSITNPQESHTMIAIVNVSPEGTHPLGEHTYEVRINRTVVTTFTHVRADGLGRCLLEAWKAVEKQRWEDAKRVYLDIMKACEGENVENFSRNH